MLISEPESEASLSTRKSRLSFLLFLTYKMSFESWSILSVYKLLGLSGIKPGW